MLWIVVLPGCVRAVSSSRYMLRHATRDWTKWPPDGADLKIKMYE